MCYWHINRHSQKLSQQHTEIDDEDGITGEKTVFKNSVVKKAIWGITKIKLDPLYHTKEQTPNGTEL